MCLGHFQDIPKSCATCFCDSKLSVTSRKSWQRELAASTSQTEAFITVEFTYAAKSPRGPPAEFARRNPAAVGPILDTENHAPAKITQQRVKPLEAANRSAWPNDMHLNLKLGPSHRLPTDSRPICLFTTICSAPSGPNGLRNCYFSGTRGRRR